jgi:RNA polymerase sigma-70 factor (ECF subfamily)
MSRRPDPFVARLAAEYGEDLLRFIARRVRAADARDLAQEVYVRLLRLSRTHLIRNPEAYLYRVACNLLHEFEMNRRADLAGLRRWGEEQATESQYAQDASAEVIGVASRVRATLNELPAHHRAVLVLHRQEGLTYEEIATRLAISPSTVKKYLRIGLRHCRQRLGGLE